MAKKQHWLAALTLTAGTLACSAPGLDEERTASQTAALATTNALTKNALTKNALTKNALTKNALTKNALTENALTKNALLSTTMIGAHTEGELARELLAYLYSCAMPAGTSMQLVIDGVDYGTYEGQVGLAPEWGAEGGSCDESCQRWITACLLARTNAYGVPVEISLRGAHPALTPSAEEAASFSLREGSFFGNLFADTPELLACSGPGSGLAELADRMCSLDTGCGIGIVGACDDSACAAGACLAHDGNGLPARCEDSRQRAAGDPADIDEVITVYLRPVASQCGDGYCQPGESAATCAADCTGGVVTTAATCANEVAGDSHLAADGRAWVVSQEGSTGPLLSAFGSDGARQLSVPLPPTEAGTIAIAGDTSAGDLLVASGYGSPWLLAVAADGTPRWQQELRTSTVVDATTDGADGAIVALDEYLIGSTSTGNPNDAGTSTVGTQTRAWIDRVTPRGRAWSVGLTTAKSCQMCTLSLGPIAALPAGGAVATGLVSGDIKIGNTTVSAGWVHSGFVTAIDSRGRVQWTRVLGDTATRVQAVTADGGGNIFVAGQVWSPTVILGRSMPVGSFVLSLAGDGSLRWLRSLPGATVSAVASDGGRIAVAGSFSGSIAVDGVGGVVARRYWPASDSFVLLLDGNGLLRTLRAHGSPLANDGGLSVAYRQGTLLATFSYAATTWFDGTALVPAGANDYAVYRSPVGAP